MDPEKIHLIGGDPALPANPASLATVVNVADNSLAASEAGYLNTGYGSQSHQHSLRRQQRRRHRHQRGAAAVLVAAALVVVLSVFGVYCLYSKTVGGKGRVANTTKRNLILMISDGFGPASETMARNYYQHIHGKPVDWQSPLDKILVGSSRTRSSDSFVTDSAAGATAFSCALKTYNGAIGVTDERRPCGTVLEAAKQRGMMTGLVVTSRITHATPASFSAHVVDRGMEDLIAQYQ
ncbi:vacuolar alkaline phosphatase, partial [Spiromyces aspiralis]